MDANQIIEGMQAYVLAVSKRGIVTYANRSAREGLMLDEGDDLLRRLAGERDLADFLDRCSTSSTILQHRLQISRETNSAEWLCRGQSLRRLDDATADEVLLQVELTPSIAATESVRSQLAVSIEAGSVIEVELRVRELQHRFKNGIQMMMGTLAAARRHTADESARHALDSAIQQVQAIAHVQAIVTQVLAGNTVVAQKFLETLCEAVRRSLAPACSIHCNASLAEIPVAIYTPLALIINELVTNAVKYGAGESASPIEVQLDRVDDAITLCVADSGPGFDLATSGGGSGLGLVRELARQLGGSFTVASSGGTRCIVKIPDAAHQIPQLDHEGASEG
jgi:two-component sensor histidine kinase